MKAVIFDMDGVLIDSEPLWKIAEIEGFGKVGINLTRTDCEETVGLRIDEVVKLWHKKVGWQGKTIQAVTDDIVDILVREINQQGKALPGVLESLTKIRDAGYKIGLATSSYQRIIHAVLNKLNIEKYFDEVHSAEFEIFGKPHPAVFLTTAEKLHTHPTDCLVIEDSFNGVIAAKAARMKVIAVPEKTHRFDERLRISDGVLGSLEEFRLTDAVELFK